MSNFGKFTNQVADFINNHRVAVTSVITAGVGLGALKWYCGGGVCRSKALLKGKTVLITGANTGIGKETARDLARRGARVILACRDTTRAETAAEEIRKSTGNKDVVVYILDLASLKSVRQCAGEVIEKEPRLDILINNAGVMWCPKWKSEEGFEMQFAVNHLGHFLFTNLLLDLLKKSAPSRIVNVSSSAHTRGKIDFDDINGDKEYSPTKAYDQSKLANVLFTRELSKRLEAILGLLADLGRQDLGSNVTVNALHPGVILTELTRHMHLTNPFPRWQMALVHCVKGIVLKTPTQGAQTTVHCAVAEDLEGVTGKYFSDCALKATAPQAVDDEAARRLWTISEEMVGMKT